MPPATTSRGRVLWRNLSSFRTSFLSMSSASPSSVGSMLSSFLGSKNTKPILERVEDDLPTKLRLKYSPYYRAVEAVQGVKIKVAGRDMLMMSSNEYLGLSQHPKVVEAAQKAASLWGASSCGSRLANGSRGYHEALEEELAAFLGKEACHVIVAGYLACQGSLATLARRGDALIVDNSIHSSLWDGAQLSKADIERFAHGDMNSLRALLATLDPKQAKLIAVDGVYSMEGHLAPMTELVELADKHDAFLLVDDAHGLGVFGNQGRGVCDHFGVTDKVDLIVGSFSKSLASTGGFMAGSRAVIEYLRSNCKQIIFSAGLTPATAEAARAALRVIQEEPERQQRVQANAAHLRSRLDALGLDYWQSPTPAIPIVIGNKEKCYFVWQSLWDQGFFTVMSIAPGVPAGKDLIRAAVSALHTPEELDRFAEALRVACKKAGVPVK